MKKFKSFYKMALPLLTVSAMTVTIPLVPVSNKSENNNNKLKATNKVKAIQEFTIDTWTISGNIMSASSTQLQGEDKINFDVTTSSSDNSININKLLIKTGGENNSTIDSAARRYNLKFNNFEGEYSAYTVKELNFGGRGAEISESLINDSLYTNYPILKGIATVYIPDSVSTLAEYSFSPYALKDIVLSETTPVAFEEYSLETIPTYLSAGILPTAENSDYYLNNLHFPACYASFWQDEINTAFETMDLNEIYNKYDKYEGSIKDNRFKSLGVVNFAHNVSFDDSITIIPYKILSSANVHKSLEGYSKLSSLKDSLEWACQYVMPSNLIACNDITLFAGNNLIMPASLEFFGEMAAYKNFIDDEQNIVNNGFSNNIESNGYGGYGLISSIDFSEANNEKNLLEENELKVDFSKTTKLKVFPIFGSLRIFNLAMPDTVSAITCNYETPCGGYNFTSLYPNLKTFTFSSNLKVISESYFWWNINASSPANNNNIKIDIPASVNKISNTAFRCLNNAEIKINVTDPSHFVDVGYNIFTETPGANFKIILPTQQAVEAFGADSRFSDYKQYFVPASDEPQPDSIDILYNGEKVTQPLALSGHENITGSAQLSCDVKPDNFSDLANWSIVGDNQGDNISIDQSSGTLSWQNLAINTYSFKVRAEAEGFSSVATEIDVNLTIEKVPVTSEITDIKVYDGEKEVTGETPIKIESETGSGTHTLTAQVIGTGDFDTQVNWNLETTSLSENVSVNNGVVKWQNLEANGNTYNFKITASANGKPIISKEINFELTVGQAPVTPEITDIKVYSEGKEINTNNPLVIWNEKNSGTHTLTAEVIGTGDYDKTVKWNLETTSINENITFENGVINWSNLEEGKYEFKVQVTANGNESVSKDINIELNIGVKPKKDNTMIYAIAGSVGAIVLIAIITTVAIVLKKKK